MKSSRLVFGARRVSSNTTSAILATLLMLCAAVVPPLVQAAEDTREPELPLACGAIEAPAGNKVSFHVYAAGFQIYQWNGTSWAFVGPVATLYANADLEGEVGTHYAGPTWESNSGSKVVGSRVDGCSPDAGSIPWLLLRAVTTEGPGVFSRVTFVQRVNTVGGLAPSAPGSFVGEVREVFYTAEYVFYRAAK